MIRRDYKDSYWILRLLNIPGLGNVKVRKILDFCRSRGLSISAFMRKNEDFEENFSIGLVYYPRNYRGDIHLLRCNGPHGPHTLFDHHNRFHIHKANQADIDSGMKAERNAYITKEYASYQDALGFFLKKCNIINAEEFFKGVLQHNLFSSQGGE